MKRAIRVGVVDDHPIFRDGVIFALETAADIEIVGHGESADDALEIVANNAPDVLLLDMKMPGGGMNALSQISRRYPSTKILILTVVDDKEQVSSAMKRGASGYVLKGANGAELINAVRLTDKGQGYISPTFAGALLANLNDGHGATQHLAEKFPELTAREEQVLSLIVRGLSNREIGRELDLSAATVKGYVTTIMAKLKVSSRVEAALLASNSPANHQCSEEAVAPSQED